MIKLRQAIVVEGKYDKNTLAQIVDAPIFVTNGFGIFKDKAQMALLRRVAETRGLIVLTDADGAGFVIRNHLKSAIDPKYLYHAYIPDVYGKERRKREAGKEGKLGVEGMPKQVLLDALERAGVFPQDTAPDCGLTKQDFVRLGLSGGKDSSEKRRCLIQKLKLPEHMSANALLQALNLLYSAEEVERLVKEGENDD